MDKSAPLGVFNVFVDLRKFDRDIDECEFTLYPFMKPLLEKLVRTNPNWEFYGIASSQGANPDTGKMRYTVSRFEVMVADECIGQIARDYRYSRGTSGDIYEFTCPSLEAGRRRNQWTHTKDINKAFKLITGNFKPKTVAEIIGEARSLMSQRIITLNNQTSYGVDKAYNDMQQPLLAYFMQHPEILVGIADESAAGEQCAKLISACSNRKDVATMLEMRDANAIRLVLKRGEGSYWVFDNDKMSGDVVGYTDADLPERLATGLGVLKVVPTGQFVAGIGLRASEKVFCILPEVEG